MDEQPAGGTKNLVFPPALFILEILYFGVLFYEWILKFGNSRN